MPGLQCCMILCIGMWWSSDCLSWLVWSSPTLVVFVLWCGGVRVADARVIALFRSDATLVTGVYCSLLNVVYASWCCLFCCISLGCALFVVVVHLCVTVILCVHPFTHFYAPLLSLLASPLLLSVSSYQSAATLLLSVPAAKSMWCAGIVQTLQSSQCSKWLRAMCCW